MARSHSGEPLLALVVALRSHDKGEDVDDDDDERGRRFGVLDLRLGTEQGAYIQGALRIPLGVAGLQDRFSWLPPRNGKGRAGAGGAPLLRPHKRLIVLCNEAERASAQRALAAWDVEAFVTKQDETFWAVADQLGLLQTELGSLAVELLFEPSSIARLVVQMRDKEVDRPAKRFTTLLDLGCGAGRDLVWMVQNGNTAWRATGIDNLYSIVRRARILAHEMQVEVDRHSGRLAGVEAVVWAQASDDGALEALQQVSETSMGRGVPVESEKSFLDATGRVQAFAARFLPHKTYDVLLLVRFLPPRLLANLHALSHVGTLIAVSHFTTVRTDDNVMHGHLIHPSFTNPPPEKRFEASDIQCTLDAWTKDGTVWSLAHHAVEPCEDGRPLRNVIFRREA